MNGMTDKQKIRYGFNDDEETTDMYGNKKGKDTKKAKAKKKAKAQKQMNDVYSGLDGVGLAQSMNNVKDKSKKK